MERRFRALVEQSAQGIALLQDHRFVFVNRAYAEIFGYTAEEILAMSPYEAGTLIHDEDRPAVFARYMGHLEGKGPPTVTEFRGVRRDGELRWLESRVGSAVFSGRPALQTSLTDITERRRSSDALRESEERFRTLAESTAAGIFIYQGDRTVYVNPAASSITGYAPEELLARTFWDIIHPDDREQVRQRGQKRLRGEDVEPRYLVRILSREGCKRWLDFSARPITHLGHPAVLGTVFDVTAQKEAEEALRESETSFRALSEESPGLIFIYQERRIVYVNARCEEVTGYPRAEFYADGFDFEVLIAPEYRQAIRANLARHDRGEDVPPVEYEIVGKGGSPRFPAVLNTRLIEYRGGRAILGVITDLTERKRAEEALRESEEKYRALVDHSIQGMAIVQGNPLRVVFANPTLAEILGYTTAELLALDPREIPKVIHAEDAARVFGLYEQRITGAIGPGRYEIRVFRKGGEPRWLEAHVSRTVFGGEPAIQATLMDITEWRRAREERERLEAQVRHTQKLESLGILAGGIAHDFNNLLTGVLGNADLALSEIDPENAARPYLERITSSARHLADLTRQMLAYSGKGRFVVEAIHLDRLVEEMTHLLKVSIAKNVELRFDFAPDLPPMVGDASQIRQVVMNLMTNASEAIGTEAGVVSVRAGVSQVDRSFLASTYLDDGLETGPYLWLEVADSGSGMDEETRARIFDPFFTTKFTGRGLGLAAVLGIVRGHGGAIRVESERGRGTTIRVLFPVRPLPEGGPAEERRDPDGVAGRILVVDDERSVRVIAQKMLERAGYEVVLAESGEQALAAVQAGAGGLSAVLLDLTMPGAGGESTFRTIRTLAPNLPVLLMSGYEEKDCLTRFGANAPAGFLQKPFDWVGMIRQVEAVLGRR